MSATAVDNRALLADNFTGLLDADPAGADRDVLGQLMRQARRVRGFLDGFDVACARRSKELNAVGQSESAFGMFLDSGCGSGKEAYANETREQICADLPEFETALGEGAVSNHHLDALGRQTRNLSGDERDELKAHQDELLGHAQGQTAESFEKTVKNLVTRIRDRNKPDSDLDELNRQRRDSNISTWVDKTSGMRKTMIELDPIRHEHWWRVYDAHLARLKAEPGSKDKTFQQLKVDAFLAAFAGDATGAPTRRPVGPMVRVPQVTVLIDLETFLHGRHAATIAELTDGTPIPVASIREMLCNADILPAVLGGHGEVLDLGRSRRLATRAQRDALAAQYRTCVEPGCEVPVDQCHAHHVTHWEHDGRSDLHNFVPLCPTGHQRVHEQGWGLTVEHPDDITWTRPDGSVSYHGPAPNQRRAPDPP